MLFSDNVSLRDEVALKRLARERRLFLMGPDCGTAIINGVPLAFANVVRRGAIGCVAASGTGLQQVTCLIDRLGAGISQSRSHHRHRSPSGCWPRRAGPQSRWSSTFSAPTPYPAATLEEAAYAAVAVDGGPHAGGKARRGTALHSRSLHRRHVLS
jgi:hypothetical protein